MSSLTIVYPLDFARTRLAVDVGKGASREYKGLADCMLKTLKTDGPVGLYRGFIVSVQGIFLYRACYFGLFDATQNYFTKEGEKLHFFQNWGIAQVRLFKIGNFFG